MSDKSHASNEKSASTRALAVFDIVTLVVQELPFCRWYALSRNDWSQYGSWESIALHPGQSWLNSGILSRGVNRLWKEIVDEAMVSSITRGSCVTLDWSIPFPYMRILQAEPTLLRHRALSLDFGPSDKRKAEAACVLLSSCLDIVRDLRLAGSTLARSASFCAINNIPGLHHLAALSLRIDWFTEIGPKELKGHDDTQILAFLARLKSLSSLDITISGASGGEYNSYRFCIPPRQKQILLSFPTQHMTTLKLRFLGSVDIPSEELSPILGRFPLLHTLELEINSPQRLKHVFPPTVTRLSCLLHWCRTLPNLYRVLADPLQLPALASVPEVKLGSDSWGSSYRDPYKDVALRLVPAAIEGLRARGTVLDLDANADALYAVCTT